MSFPNREVIGTVRGDHQRVVRLSQFLNRCEDFTDYPVELMNEVAVFAALAGAPETGMRREWVVMLSVARYRKNGLPAPFWWIQSTDFSVRVVPTIPPSS